MPQKVTRRVSAQPVARSFVQPSGLAVTAQPVRALTDPSAGTKLTRLAGAFGKAGGALQTLVAKQDEREEARGRTAAQEGTSLADIEDVSERFRVGYRAAQGKLQANEKLRELRAELQTNKHDPDYDFESAAQAAFKSVQDMEGYAESPEEYQFTLANQLNAGIENLRSSASAVKAEATQEQALQTTLTNASAALRNLGSAGELNAAFQGIFSEARSLGIDPAEFNRWRVGQLEVLAEERNDPGVFQAAELADSNGAKLSDHPTFGPRIRAAQAQAKARAASRAASARLSDVGFRLKLQREQLEGTLTTDKVEAYSEAGFITEKEQLRYMLDIQESGIRQEKAAQRAETLLSGAYGLPTKEYDADFDLLLQNTPPEERTQTQLALLATNGRMPTSLKKRLANQAASTNPEAVQTAYSEYKAMQAQVPAVASQLDEKTRGRMEVLDVLLSAHDGSFDAAYGDLDKVQENLPTARKEVMGRDARRKIGKTVRSFKGGDNIETRKYIESRATQLIATGRYGADEAIEKAEEMYEASTTVIGGRVVPNSDIYPLWQDKDIERYTVRKVVPRLLAEKGLSVDPDVYSYQPETLGGQQTIAVYTDEGRFVMRLDAEALTREGAEKQASKRRAAERKRREAFEEERARLEDKRKRDAFTRRRGPR